jgi:hypothetical protein
METAKICINNDFSINIDEVRKVLGESHRVVQESRNSSTKDRVTWVKGGEEIAWGQNVRFSGSFSDPVVADRGFMFVKNPKVRPFKPMFRMITDDQQQVVSLYNTFKTTERIFV